MKKTVLAFTLSISLATNSPAKASRCADLFVKPLGSPPGKIISILALVGLLSGGVWFFTDDTPKAWRQGKEHIGFGIYLDMEAIRAHLSPEERALLENPTRNALHIARIFSDKLNGDYDRELNQIQREQGAVEYYQGRDALTFFKGCTDKKRGVCRHKALILSSILKRIGIRNEYRGGWVDLSSPVGGRDLHNWVLLLDENTVVDPTANRIEDAETYRRNLNVKGEKIAVPPVKPYSFDYE